ncbi:thioredoxin family protein [Pedobacter sp. SD-b]|uniref:Thioredoxin family protein n=1 Tax=Pedobacter segetis TaxID=2793069 RepID=A0ABS1BMN5_9SPHI|nr:thioredoxin family protein [Pedobacter segetis]MBK0384121.1 thioredoxin family protein [Pedobacter segetis]
MIYTPEIIENALSYQQYRTLIDELLLDHRTTGNDVDTAFVHYTRLNVQRMKRLDKTTTINKEIEKRLKLIDQYFTFLIVTEGWCGDAAQTIPVINKIAELSNGKISVRLVLRDRNLDIIDAHLTNGGRAIPIVIILDKDRKEIGSWGPRPAILQQEVSEWVKDLRLTKEDRIEKVHAWYAQDKTMATQSDFLELLKAL